MSKRIIEIIIQLLYSYNYVHNYNDSEFNKIQYLNLVRSYIQLKINVEINPKKIIKQKLNK